MTKLLEEAVDKLKNMTDSEQDSIARLILEEISFDYMIEGTMDKLDIPTRNALKDNEEGKTTEIKIIP